MSPAVVRLLPSTCSSMSLSRRAGTHVSQDITFSQQKLNVLGLLMFVSNKMGSVEGKLGGKEQPKFQKRKIILLPVVLLSWTSVFSTTLITIGRISCKQKKSVDIIQIRGELKEGCKACKSLSLSQRDPSMRLQPAGRVSYASAWSSASGILPFEERVPERPKQQDREKSLMA